MSNQVASGPVLSQFSLEGKTALVTGGTRGIGQAMAIGFAEAGASVILAQRNPNSTETRDVIRRLGRKCEIYAADMSNRESINGLIPRIMSGSPGINLCILLNCAGTIALHRSEKFPDDVWDEVLRINLTSSFQLCRVFGAYLLSKPAPASSHRGSIVNITSLLAFQGGINTPAYAASKGGLAQVTKALSNEWAGRGISVNAIAPGWIETAMTDPLQKNKATFEQISVRIPAGRWGDPADLKGPAVFLASDASRYVSGETLVVDGGWMGR